jgi:peptide-methionine (S)-S-oxide reductase
MKNLETAVFGGGCFWCTEAIFQNLKGVESVLPGYSGGTVPNPTYEQVCNGSTGHAEATKIDFNPEIIKFEVLLEVFFATHDPTTKNRQGGDVGEQYRSVIFYTTPEQKQTAEIYIKEAQKEFVSPIVTLLQPLDKFYEAENYHQNYFAENPDKAYCRVVINPKLEKFKKKFANLLK